MPIWANISSSADSLTQVRQLTPIKTSVLLRYGGSCSVQTSCHTLLSLRGQGLFTMVIARHPTSVPACVCLHVCQSPHFPQGRDQYDGHVCTYIYPQTSPYTDSHIWLIWMHGLRHVGHGCYFDHGVYPYFTFKTHQNKRIRIKSDLIAN